jgi:hypothetical protein
MNKNIWNVALLLGICGSQMGFGAVNVAPAQPVAQLPVYPNLNSPATNPGIGGAPAAGIAAGPAGASLAIAAGAPAAMPAPSALANQMLGGAGSINAKGNLEVGNRVGITRNETTQQILAKSQKLKQGYIRNYLNFNRMFSSGNLKKIQLEDLIAYNITNLSPVKNALAATCAADFEGMDRVNSTNKNKVMLEGDAKTKLYLDAQKIIQASIVLFPNKRDAKILADSCPQAFATGLSSAQRYATTFENNLGGPEQAASFEALSDVSKLKQYGFNTQGIDDTKVDWSKHVARVGVAGILGGAAGFAKMFGIGHSLEGGPQVTLNQNVTSYSTLHNMSGGYDWTRSAGSTSSLARTFPQFLATGLAVGLATHGVGLVLIPVIGAVSAMITAMLASGGSSLIKKIRDKQLEKKNPTQVGEKLLKSGYIQRLVVKMITKFEKYFYELAGNGTSTAFGKLAFSKQGFNRQWKRYQGMETWEKLVFDNYMASFVRLFTLLNQSGINLAIQYSNEYAAITDLNDADKAAIRAKYPNDAVQAEFAIKEAEVEIYQKRQKALLEKSKAEDTLLKFILEFTGFKTMFCSDEYKSTYQGFLKDISIEGQTKVPQFDPKTNQPIMDPANPTQPLLKSRGVVISNALRCDRSMGEVYDEMELYSKEELKMKGKNAFKGFIDDYYAEQLALVNAQQAQALEAVKAEAATQVQTVQQTAANQLQTAQQAAAAQLQAAQEEKVQELQALANVKGAANRAQIATKITAAPGQQKVGAIVTQIEQQQAEDALKLKATQEEAINAQNAIAAAKLAEIEKQQAEAKAASEKAAQDAAQLKEKEEATLKATAERNAEIQLAAQKIVAEQEAARLAAAQAAQGANTQTVTP